MRTEDYWYVDEECREDYERMVALGRGTAQNLSACVVGIARNAMPALENTLGLIAEVRAGFASCPAFVFENDSIDGTAVTLDAAEGVAVQHETLGGIDSRGFEPERTTRLAYCRNKCHDWVREHAAGARYTIVLDLDPAGGFSVDGVFNSIAWLETLSLGCGVVRPGAMAAYSLMRVEDGGQVKIAHYDAWAARPVCWWRDRREEIGFGWFSQFLPPVGSLPMPMNSAFGGLCVYKTEAFLAAGEKPYEGGDCEHVFLHKKMRQAGWQVFLNPGSRYISIWR